ncbi:MAG TPA: nuclear transport factor 2 family protein [Flavobacteriales bacterium]|nr:nuclear transport factor 2 family protein [Flavobacteriales bacterium]
MKDHTPTIRSNDEIVRALYHAFSNRNIAAMLELLDENVEWGEPENPFNPAGGTRHGHAGFLEWISIGKREEEIMELLPQRTLTDRDAIAVIGHMKCRAIRTQKTYASDFVHLIVIEKGKIVKFQEFFDTYAAGEAFQ